ncbi:MAG: flagellar protein FlaG [Eubacteriales bacterium]
MIEISRPTFETNKTVNKTQQKSLESNLRDSDQSKILKVTPIEIEDAQDINIRQLEKAIEETNEMIFRDNDHFEFKIHEGTGRIMVKLVDNQTDEIIKEIPPEKILDLVANIWDLVGILVDERG